MDEVDEMKPPKVCHQLCFSSVGEQKQQPERLNEESMAEDDDATAWVSGNETPDRIAGSIEERVKGFGSGTVDVGKILPLPISEDVRVTVCFAGISKERRLKKGELLDRPLFDGNVRKAAAQGLGCLLGPQKRRDNDKCGLAADPVDEFLRLLTAELS
jgi:hypothetical protein